MAQIHQEAKIELQHAALLLILSAYCASLYGQFSWGVQKGFLCSVCLPFGTLKRFYVPFSKTKLSIHFSNFLFFRLLGSALDISINAERIFLLICRDQIQSTFKQVIKLIFYINTSAQQNSEPVSYNVTDTTESSMFKSL